MTSISTSTISASNLSCVPYVPQAISYALVAMQPLANRLAELSSVCAHLSQADCSEIELKKLELLQQVEACEEGLEELIIGTVADINLLFCHLSAYLQIEGQRVETAALKASSPSDTTLKARLSKLETDSNFANGTLQMQIKALKLNPSNLYANGLLCTDKLLDACVDKLRKLQKRWTDNRTQAQEQLLQIQMESIYASAADSLIDICHAGLKEQITIDPLPQQQEDALSAMTTCLDFPYSGAWPALAQCKASTFHTEA